MCYYNGIKVTRIEYIALKELEKISVAHVKEYMKEVHNGFNFNECAVVVANPEKDHVEVTAMEWGFIPGYLRTREEVKRMRSGYKTEAGTWQPAMPNLNAVGEKMLEPKKIFRDAALKRRCLVLSSGFYEWRHVPVMGKKGQVLKKTDKFPYHIGVKGESYFYLAGIWQPWTDRETGELVHSFAIVTTEANSLMAQVHNSAKRMPVILPHDLAYEWIMGRDLTEARIKEIAAFQYPYAEMEAYSIAKEFITSDQPATAVQYEGLSPLEECM